MTSYGSSRRGGSSATVTGYLKDDRTMATADVASKWQQELSDITNCDITAEVEFFHEHDVCYQTEL